MPCLAFTYEMMQKLSPSEKDRLLACACHTENGKTDYDAAARDLGSASGSSVATMLNASRRKVKAAIEGGEPAASSPAGKGTPKKAGQNTPKKADQGTPKKNSRKRKGAGEDAPDDDSAVESPKKPRIKATNAEPMVKHEVAEEEEVNFDDFYDCA